MTNMDNIQNEKAAIANFLGSIMSKSKELESGTVMPVSKQNNHGLIDRVASEIDAKLTPQPQAPAPVLGVDVAAQLIPYNVDPASLGIEPPSEPPIAGTVTQGVQQPVTTREDPDQLEFDFSEPNGQTKIILGEIKLLNTKLNKLLSIVEGLQSSDRTNSSTSTKRPTTKKVTKQAANIKKN